MARTQLGKRLLRRCGRHHPIETMRLYPIDELGLNRGQAPLLIGGEPGIGMFLDQVERRHHQRWRVGPSGLGGDQTRQQTDHSQHDADAHGPHPFPLVHRLQSLVRIRLKDALARVGTVAAVLAVLAAGPAFAVEATTLTITSRGNGVHVVTGSTNEASLDNQGRVGNAGFIVGTDGTVVINTGSSYQHGRELLDMAERLGGKPVVLAVITQPLQEFIMGNAAFAERGIPLLAHEDGAKLIGERCAQCLRNLTRLLGESAMQGTRVVVPERTVQRSTDIEAGGRRLRLLHHGWGSTPGDLAVFDPVSGTLFAGALVSIDRVPDLRDADPQGWLAALGALADLAPHAVVPGYGPIGGVEALDPMRRYIEQTTLRVRALLESGASLYETTRSAELPEFSHWALYSVLHPRNVHKLYLQMENDELNH